MNILDYWKKNLESSPDALIIADSLHPGGFTRAQADYYSSKVCAYLKSREVGKEDTVVILMPRGALPFIVLLGVYKAGAAAVILEDHYPADRIAYIKNDCNAKLVFDMQAWTDTTDFEPALEYADVDLHDLAFIVYTSGTTGNPKGVAHEYGNISKSIETIPEGLAMDEKFFGLIAPLNFVASMIVFHALMSGVLGSAYVFTYDVIKNPVKLITSFHDLKIDCIFASPSMLRAMNYLPGSGVTTIITGSEPANDTYKEGISILNTYSMSESGFFVGLFFIDKPYEVCPVGIKAMTTPGLVLLDDDGNEAGEGQTGELCFPNPYFRGYLNLPEQTAEVLKDGLYHSGDLGKIDENGQLLLLGRKNDMIKINGNRVEPGEIEAVAKAVLGLKWCAAKGFITNTRAYLCLYYTEDVSFDENEARLKMGEKLPYYMIPSFFMKIDEVPLLPNGKLNRKVLPEPKRVHAEEYKEPQTDLQKLLCNSAERVLGVERVGISDDFYNLGGDSLSTMIFIETVGIPQITAADVFQGRTAEKIEQLYLEKIERLKGFNPEDYEAEARKKEYELSGLQIAYIDEYMYKPFDPSCDVSCCYEFDLDTDADKLAAAVNEVMENTPVFSTVFAFNTDGMIVQRIEPGVLRKVQVTDITEEEFAGMKLNRKFKLFLRTMAYCDIYRTDKRIILYMTFSHAVMDGMGLQIILDRIKKAYRSESLPLDKYYSCLEYTESGKTGKSYSDSKKYFESTYSGKDWTCNLTPDKDEDEIVRVPAFVPSKMTIEKLEQMEHDYGVSRNTVILSAAMIAMSRIEKSSNIMFNWTYHDRSDEMKMDAAGIIMKRLPIGVDLSAMVNYKDLFDSVRMQSVEGITHSEYAWLNYNENFLITDTADFVYETADVMSDDSLSSIGGRSLTSQLTKTGSLRRFVVAALEIDGKLVIALGYIKGLYSEDLIKHYEEELIKVLNEISDSEYPLSLPVN